MTQVVDLTVEELVSIIRSAVREAVHTHEVEDGPNGSPAHPDNAMVATSIDSTLPPYIPAKNPRGILELPPLNLGPMRDGVQLISREEFYGDDGR
jgi:hypothetical protein